MAQLPIAANSAPRATRPVSNDDGGGAAAGSIAGRPAQDASRPATTHATANLQLVNCAPRPSNSPRNDVGARLIGVLRAVPLLLALGACASTGRGTYTGAPLPSAPPAATITLVERSWHTDVCVRVEDAGEFVVGLAQRIAGANFLCFGFGERQYVTQREHGLLTMISALFPSQGALLMTVLRDTPAAAFGAENTVALGVSTAGLAGLQAYLHDAVDTDASGGPLRLGDGPYPGSVFFGATGTYDLLHTCNTWTAAALRSAGLPIRTAGVIFAGGVMRQAQPLSTPLLGSTP